MSMTFTKANHFIRNTEIFASKIDDEVVMMDDASGLYFALNPVAGKIWSLLEVPVNFHILLDKLIEMYEVSLEQCQSDLHLFLTEMLNAGISGTSINPDLNTIAQIRNVIKQFENK